MVFCKPSFFAFISNNSGRRPTHQSLKNRQTSINKCLKSSNTQHKSITNCPTSINIHPKPMNFYGLLGLHTSQESFYVLGSVWVLTPYIVRRRQGSVHHSGRWPCYFSAPSIQTPPRSPISPMRSSHPKAPWSLLMPNKALASSGEKADFAAGTGPRWEDLDGNRKAARK